jgi:hypothetical protein
MSTTKSFEVDDKLIIAGRTDTLWRVHQVTPVLNADGSTCTSVGLVDDGNPQVGTAFYDYALTPLVIDHIKPGEVRTELIGNLTADIIASGYNAPGPAETLARRLANLGWTR